MNVHTLMDEFSVISLSSIASDDEFSFEDLSSKVARSAHEWSSPETLEKMTNHIKRLQKRIRYLEKNLVECKKENKRLRRDVIERSIISSSYIDSQESLDTANITSHAASLRVLRDLINLFESSHEETSQSTESSGLMDLVRSLHYLSVSVKGLGKGQEAE